MLTDEQADLQRLAHDFAAAELRPRAAAWDSAGELPEGLFEEFAELGFMSMRVPLEEGGLDLDPVSSFLVLTELSWGDASAALAVAQHNCAVAEALVRFGTEAQGARWFPELASGARPGVVVPGEEDSGSTRDPSSLQAERAGDGWILEGEVRRATLGDRAGLLLVFAASSSLGGATAPDGPPHRSAFLVPREVDGLTAARTGRTLGLCAAGQARIGFDAVRLPPDALLGSFGEGGTVQEEVLAMARLGLAALSVGIARAALGHAARYASEREQFGRAIAEFGGIREKLGEMVLRTDLTRGFLLAEGRRWARNHREGGGAMAPDGERYAGAAIAKVSASEAAMWCADQAVQIFGGYGYMRDYPVEKLMRDAKGMEILFGPNELLRGTLATAALRRAE